MAESGQPIKIGNSFAIEEIKQSLIDLEGTEFDTLDERLKAIDNLLKENTNSNNSILSYVNDKGISIEEFGAIGDGESDDTIPIENAFLSSYPVIFFPKGEYRTSRTIQMPSNKRITGADKHNSIIFVESPTIVGFLLNSCENLVIDNLTFTHKATISLYELDAPWRQLLHEHTGAGAKNITIQDCVFKESGKQAITTWSERAENWKIVNNISLHTGREFFFASGAKGVDVSHNYINRSGDDAIALNLHTRNSTCVSNIIINAGLSDRSNTRGAGIKVHGYENVITNNVIKDPYESGISLWLYDDTDGYPRNNIVQGNVIEGMLQIAEGPAALIQIKGMLNASIKNNILKAPKDLPEVSGVSLENSGGGRPLIDSRLLEVTGNEFHNCRRMVQIATSLDFFILENNSYYVDNDSKEVSRDLIYVSGSQTILGVVDCKNNKFYSGLLRSLVYNIGNRIERLNIIGNTMIDYTQMVFINTSSSAGHINIMNTDLIPTKTTIAGTARVDSYYIKGITNLKDFDRGVATIPAGSSSVTINLNIAGGLTLARFMLEVKPSSNLNNATKWHITNSGTSFTINLDQTVNPLVNFDWKYEYWMSN